MKQRVYYKRYDRIMVGMPEEPFREYDRSIRVRIMNDGSLGPLSVSHITMDEAKELVPVFVAHAGAKTVDDFIKAIEKEGFKDQQKAPFYIEWELERTLEKAERLQKKLEAYNVER